MTAKIDIAHAKSFGIKNASNEFYSLIDKLRDHSNWKYPERKWSIDTYYHIAFQWIGKEKELKKLVAKHIATMKEAKVLTVPNN